MIVTWDTLQRSIAGQQLYVFSCQAVRTLCAVLRCQEHGNAMGNMESYCWKASRGHVANRER